jgi:hypothetical protein
MTLVPVHRLDLVLMAAVAIRHKKTREEFLRIVMPAKAGTQ